MVRCRQSSDAALKDTSFAFGDYFCKILFIERGVCHLLLKEGWGGGCHLRLKETSFELDNFCKLQRKKDLTVVRRRHNGGAVKCC